MVWEMGACTGVPVEARGIRFPLESRTFACPPSSGFWDLDLDTPEQQGLQHLRKGSFTVT